MNMCCREHLISEMKLTFAGYEVGSWLWNYQEMDLYADCIECNGGTAICNGEEFCTSLTRAWVLFERVYSLVFSYTK